VNVIPMSGLETVPATGVESLAWLLVVIPLLSAGVLLLAGRAADRWGHWLGLAASAAAFLVGAAVFLSVLGHDGEERARAVAGFSWVPAGTFQVDAGLLVDPLSLCFVLLITFVGTLIHVYSVEYMAHDADRRRFFAYLNLFVAAMLLLVLADSYLLLYVGWEGVGLASYLLIGFWNHRIDYAVAAKKAFIANRVGDFGLSIAIMAMFVSFGSVQFDDVLSGAAGASETWLTVIGLMLLLAACGKSAQFPLQSWLGDAMAGPTPVSALIHAATMVTAGVYLVVRSGPIFEGAPAATTAVAVVGAITLLYGAIVGCAKDDIKKALAASTMSQIGYMMLAAGLGPVGYVFAIFHLLTHGFFKAGMFLGAGSVMHGMGDETDMRRFGGIRSVMLLTWVTFGLGWLAIIGVPPFSGFVSKDKIIHAAFEGEGWQPYVLGPVAVIGAGLTAFYMTRLFFMTFHGRRRWHDGTDAPAPHPHESPLLMVAPMVGPGGGLGRPGRAARVHPLDRQLARAGVLRARGPRTDRRPEPGDGGDARPDRPGRRRWRTCSTCAATCRSPPPGEPRHAGSTAGPVPGRRQRHRVRGAGPGVRPRHGRGRRRPGHRRRPRPDPVRGGPRVRAVAAPDRLRPLLRPVHVRRRRPRRRRPRARADLRGRP
jgi:NADH-quinone oxidoreductase subunit L